MKTIKCPEESMKVMVSRLIEMKKKAQTWKKIFYKVAAKHREEAKNEVSD